MKLTKLALVVIITSAPFMNLSAMTIVCKQEEDKSSPCMSPSEKLAQIELNTELFDCIQSKGTAEQVKALLEKGAEANAREHYRGNTPLIQATMHGLVEVCEVLIEHGADVDMKNKRGGTALLWACGEHTECSQLLIDNGADVNINSGSALIWHANRGNKELVISLLNHGAKVNAKRINGETALYVATQYGHEEVALILLENGAEVNVTDEHGRTPLMLAINRELNKLSLKLIEAGADVNAKPAILLTAVRYVSDKYCLECTEVVAALIKKGIQLDHRDAAGQTPLMIAIDYKRARIAKLLIEAGADVNAKDMSGQTALIMSLQYRTRNEKLATMLVDHGAEVNNNRDIDGDTPLLLATRRMFFDLCLKLIDKGADVNACNKDNVTPLIIAAMHKDEDFCLVLIQSGARISVKDADGRTPLLTALHCKLGRLYNRLLNRGVDINTKGLSWETTPLLVAINKKLLYTAVLLIKRGADVNATDEDGTTPLNLAISMGFPQLSLVLIDHGANINTQDTKGNTPLMNAIGRPYYFFNGKSNPRLPKVVYKLIKAEANLSRENERGETALSWALEANYRDIVIKIIEAFLD